MLFTYMTERRIQYINCLSHWYDYMRVFVIRPIVILSTIVQCGESAQQ